MNVKHVLMIAVVLLAFFVCPVMGDDVAVSEDFPAKYMLVVPSGGVTLTDAEAKAPVSVTPTFLGTEEYAEILVYVESANDWNLRLGDANEYDLSYGVTVNEEEESLKNGDKVLSAIEQNMKTEVMLNFKRNEEPQKAGTYTDVLTFTAVPVDRNTQIVTSADELQNLLDDAEGDVSILLTADIIGDVTVEQKPDVKITINGNNKKFDGVITVNGKSKSYDTAVLTIKNVNFEADSISTDAFIRLGVSGDTNIRYTNHVTVEGCRFTYFGTKDTVAVKSYTGGDKNLVIDGCTVDAGMHSLLNVANVEEGLQITNCKVYSKNGINLNNSPSLKMSGCTFEVTGYAVRFGVNGNTLNGNFEIKDSTLQSANGDGEAVIIFRGTATGSTLYLTGTVLEGTPEITGNANIIR